MTDYLNMIPAVLRAGLVFLAILWVIRKKWTLGHAFSVGALCMGLIFCKPVPDILAAALFAMVELKSLSLVVIVSLILVLSTSMEKTGQMTRMLKRFKGLIRFPLLNLILFPALIGLLPMPGGAVFSAPMVKDLGKQTHLSDENLSFINYWFRHIWEYFWPLYPGILLTTALAGIDLGVIVFVMFPMTITAVIAGILQIGRISADKKTKPSAQSKVWPFINELLPILQVILMGIGGGSLLIRLFPDFVIAREAALVFGLLVAVMWIWSRGNLSGAEKFKIISDPNIVKMTYMILAILAFKGVLEASSAVLLISSELLKWHVPLPLVTAILPFIVGGITGITIAFVGATLPILIPLVHGAGESQYMISYVVLCIISGFTGVLLSPLHLCLILTNEYFHVSTAVFYQKLWKPCVAIFCAGMIYFVILRYLLPATLLS